MKEFENIYIVRKPMKDVQTDCVIDKIHNYAEHRDINIINDIHAAKTLIISVGGDGTMLSAMRDSVQFDDAKILGLNTGTLGFLTESLPDKLFRFLDGILHGYHNRFEERAVLTSQIHANEKMFPETLVAANEFMLNAPLEAPLVTEILINDQPVTKYMGSGVIISSPTGSTAVSLSAGGSIITPSANLMQIVPAWAHMLTVRPIITSGDDVVTIRTQLTNRVPYVNVRGDGIKHFVSPEEEGLLVVLTVKLHKKKAKIWRPSEWNFFDVLSEKMKW